MAEILITGVEMPKSCFINDSEKCNFACGGLCSITGKICGKEIPSDCSIVGEIPDNHGRIIDEKWVELYILKYFSIEFPNDMEKVYKLLKTALKDVPTILKASK